MENQQDSDLPELYRIESRADGSEWVASTGTTTDKLAAKALLGLRRQRDTVSEFRVAVQRGETWSEAA